MASKKKKISKKTINATAIAVILAVIIVGYVLMNYSPIGEPTGEKQEFDVIAFSWGFDPETIEVNRGDHVILHVTSIDVTHGIAINEYQINEALLPNKTVTIDFIADKAGTFSFYCSIACGLGHDDQKGSLIVK